MLSPKITFLIAHAPIETLSALTMGPVPGSRQFGKDEAVDQFAKNRDDAH